MKANKISLDKYLKYNFALLILTGALFVTLLAILVPVYFATKNYAILIVGAIVSAFFIIILVLGLVFTGIAFYDIFYRGLYAVSRDNLKTLSEKKVKLKRFGSKRELKEFAELNKQIDRVEELNKNLKISYIHNDYSHAGLEFLDSYYTLTTIDSMVKHYKELIYLSKAYRNAFIEITYDSADEILSDEIQNNIINAIKQNFDYQKLLIGKQSDGKKYLVFIPCIDTITMLQNEVQQFQSSTSVMSSGIEGMSLNMPKVSVVIYPYSDIDEIISDLRYASRQGKLSYFYLPNKLFLRGNDNINELSISLNNISKLISEFSKVDKSESGAEDRTIINDIFTRLVGFLNINEAGVIVFRKEVERFVTAISSTIGDDHIFKLNKHVSDTFIETINNNLDDDGSFYVSSRKHTTSEVGKYFDIYNIESGYFYIVKEKENPIALVYYVNRNSSLILDSYAREGLLMLSTRINYTLKTRRAHEELEYMQGRVDDISKLSNLRLYSIDRNTFELTSFSQTLKDRIRTLELGQKCYKALYDKDSPCKDCPLLTNKKRIFTEGGFTYETSTVLTKARTNEVDLLVSLPGDTLEDHNRFNTEYLTNSFYSFLDRLKGLFLEHSKGYIVIMTIENFKDINQEHGPEVYGLYVRQFVNKAINSVKNIKRIFSIHDNVFAIVLPEMGRVDVSDAVEALFNISKQGGEEEATKGVTLNITYDAFRYPQTFDNEKSFMTALDKYLTTRKVKEVDRLLFEENDYIRPASRKEFILNTIENAVKNNTFIMRMQPVVAASNKHMQGAEILIRLNDDNRNLLFNTFEMIRVAGENNKIAIISDILINYIGEIYNKYGLTVFKQYGFNRLSLNTDYSYFSDPQFFEKIGRMMKKYYFPKDFLGFEINEKELFDYFDKFKVLTKSILANNIAIICDQYSGEFISLDQLKDLGISEIKIGRMKVRNIDTNPDQLKEVLSIAEYAKRVNIKTTLVGVENVDQYKLVRDANKDVNMQGYYFYEPLDSIEMIDKLRKSNI